VTLFVRDKDGEVLQAGAQDGTSFEQAGGTTRAVVKSGRGIITEGLAASGLELMVTFDSAHESLLRPVLESLLLSVAEREQLEKDMESMYSGSLALMEKASMVGDTLPLLSTGETEREIATMGLKALVVAASVERALYVRHFPEVGRCEVVVQAVMDACGRSAVVGPYESDDLISTETGVVGQAHEAQTESLHHVPEGGRLGVPGSPEYMAERDVIAVPVCAGSGPKTLRLGVLLVMDKRANSYSDQDRLGSQETKLTAAVASMLGGVLGARKLAELGKEMALAHEIQEQILPSGPTEVAGFDVAGDRVTSGDVGGDYFDYVPMGDGRTLVVVADVSGHNLASGMVMVSARATLRVVASEREDVSAIFDALAADLLDDLTRTEQFITAAGAALNPGSLDVELANAGHHDTMWLHTATGEVDQLPGSSTILGFASGERYESLKVTLQPGDALLLFTDGAIEAMNPEGEMFGEDRLRQVFVAHGDQTAQEILDAVFAAVADFINSGKQEDDITAVVIKAIPGASRP
jgi:hypothetical protein